MTVDGWSGDSSCNKTPKVLPDGTALSHCPREAILMPRNKLNVFLSFCFFSISAVAIADQKFELAAPFMHNMSLSFAWELYKELDMPIGILLSAHSNTRIEAFTQRKAIENHPGLGSDAALIHDADPTTEQGRKAFDKYYKELRAWQTVAGDAADAGGRVPARPNLPGIAGMWRGPSQFFNGKINPVIPFAIRGAIWCQGTSNSGDGRIYAARMEAPVNGWRDAWGMPEMPFYFTQMQCYGSPDPESVGFADIRQVQHMFFMNNRKNVGMVVQSDLYSARPQGIHYYNKLHPGMRLARWALAKQYGRDIAYTGPIYTGYRRTYSSSSSTSPRRRYSALQRTTASRPERLAWSTPLFVLPRTSSTHVDVKQLFVDSSTLFARTGLGQLSLFLI